jgi:hypothetical protein
MEEEVEEQEEDDDEARSSCLSVCPSCPHILACSAVAAFHLYCIASLFRPLLSFD